MREKGLGAGTPDSWGVGGGQVIPDFLIHSGQVCLLVQLLGGCLGCVPVCLLSVLVSPPWSKRNTLMPCIAEEGSKTT